MKKKALFLAVALTLSFESQAEIKPTFEIGLEGGGDNLVETTTVDMNAGGGMYIGGGAEITTNGKEGFYYRAMIGYLFDTIEFKNPKGDASTDVIPLHLGAYKLFEQHELGLGAAYYLSPSYEICVSSVGCETIDFDNAFGFFLQYNYYFGNQGRVGVKYTDVDYKFESDTLDASSFGIYLGASF